MVTTGANVVGHDGTVDGRAQAEKGDLLRSLHPITADIESGYGLSPEDLVKALVEVGADCVYPIGAGEGEIAVFASRVSGPVNAMARLGVARISFGSALQRLVTTDLAHRLAAISAGADDRSE